MVDITRCATRYRVEQKDRIPQVWEIIKRFRQKLYQRWQEWCHPRSLRIKHKSHGQGESYWQAYNPRTGHSFSSASEADLRHWIEQQYHH